MTYRILVTGSRDWNDRVAVRTALDGIGFRHGFSGLVVVHGHCPTGADAFAGEWVRHNWDLGVREERHPADWTVHGRKAGPLRNRHMVSLGADICLAFIQDGSPGATGCMAMAKEAGISVFAWMTSSAVRP